MMLCKMKIQFYGNFLLKMNSVQTVSSMIFPKCIEWITFQTSLCGCYQLHNSTSHINSIMIIYTIHCAEIYGINIQTHCCILLHKYGLLVIGYSTKQLFLNYRNVIRTTSVSESNFNKVIN